MTTSDIAVAATSGGDRVAPARRHWPMLAGLGITQTIGYGVLYYAFAVYLAPMTRDLNLRAATVTGALTVAVLVGALSAIPVGRWVDRRGGRRMMTAGSVLATAAVLAWSRVDSVAALYAVFAIIGVASAMVLYEPAFAVIVAAVPAERRAGALLSVTLVAGFASSIFLPLAGLLVEWFGWRASLVVLAIAYGLVAVPLHALALPRGSRPQATARAGDETARRQAVRRALADRGFWLLVAAFVLQGAALATVAVHLVTYLVELGQPAPFAATVAGLLGILSVTGRIVTTGLRRRWPVAGVTAAAFGIQAGGVAALPFAGHRPAGAIVCVTLFGLGFGVATIARPALLAERYGTTGYASIAGRLTLPATLAKATAPLAAALVVSGDPAGYTPVMLGVAGACLVAAGLLWATMNG